MVESGTIGTEYEDITLRTSSEESYVSQNILFDRSGTHLYAMTTKKVGIVHHCKIVFYFVIFLQVTLPNVSQTS